MKRGYIISFLLGFLLVSIVSVYAIGTNNIAYKDSTVEEEIEDLYTKSAIKENITAVTNTGTLTITDNTKDSMYVAVFSYSSTGNANTILGARTSITSVTGADYEEILYSINTTSRYAIRIYRLTNCEETVTVKNGTANGGYGNMIIFD